MNIKDEALKLALEALEHYTEPKPKYGVRTAIDILRKALADNALDKMADNAKELGLDYEPIVEQVEDSVGMGHGAWDMVEPKKLAKAFHEALAERPAQDQGQSCPNCEALTKQVTALKTCLEVERGFREQEQPAQQPVAWMDAEGDVYKTEPPEGWCPPHVPFYTKDQL